jgi:hypothetical protein
MEEEYITVDGGNGSATNLEDETDAQEYSHKLDPTGAATRMHPRDIDALDVPPERKEHLRWLSRLNEDNWVSHEPRKTKEHYQRREAQKATVNMICDRVELTEYPENRVQHLFFEEVELEIGPYSVEDIAVALASLVANEDDRHVQREARFQRLMDDLEVSEKALRRLRKAFWRHL